MNAHRSLLLLPLLVVAAVSITLVSPAQAADSLSGNPVPGVCMLSREAVFAQAKIGEVAGQRLNQLAEQGRSQLESEHKSLDADIQSFQQKEASLSEAQRKQQGQALQQRMNTLQSHAKDLNERIQLTTSKIQQRIGQDAQPMVADAYTTHHCGLLLNRDVVLTGNMANDLTADVIQGLDKKITTISFDLEPLPTNKGK